MSDEGGWVLVWVGLVMGEGGDGMGDGIFG